MDGQIGEQYGCVKASACWQRLQDLYSSACHGISSVERHYYLVLWLWKPYADRGCVLWQLWDVESNSEKLLFQP